MAETQAPPTLAEQYVLGNSDVATKPVEVKVAETPETLPTKEVVSEKTEEAPAAVEEAPAAVEEAPVVTPASEETSEVSPPVAETETNPDNTPEESSDISEASADQEVAEETPEIKIETAPADFRFPTTNQTRHCFTRYVEYHRCIAAKGEEAPECDKFKKYYRSLCPGEWVDRWNEQRENGTFPGPL